MSSIESYRTRSGRRWRVRYRKPDHSSTSKGGFTRRRDAEEWMAGNVQAMSGGQWVDPRNRRVRVDSVASSWLAAKATASKPSYARTLRIAYATHVKPVFGSRRVGDVSRREIQEWVNGLADRRSPSVVRRAAGILRGILQQAVDDRLIASSPYKGIGLPKVGRSAHRYLTAGQLLTVAHCAGDREPLVLLLGFTGIRFGEASALRVGDVDVARRRVTISKSMTPVDGRMVETTPKSGKGRVVAYPAYPDSWMRRLVAGRRADCLLFSRPDGSPIRSQHSPTSKGSWWHKACQEAGLPAMRLHDLRHTAASLMVAAGANVKVVQRMLGHASAAMTLDVYADLFDSDLDEVASGMDGLVRSVG